MVQINWQRGQVKPQFGGGVLWPAGKQKCIFSASDYEMTQKGDAQMLVLTMVIIEGPLQGSSQKFRLNLFSQSEKAKEIASGQFEALLCVLGFQGAPQDTAQLHNLPFIVDVTTRKTEQYGEQNDFKTFYTADGRSLSDVLKTMNGGAAQTQPGPGFQPQGQGFAAPQGQPAPQQWAAPQAAPQHAPPQQMQPQQAPQQMQPQGYAAPPQGQQWTGGPATNPAPGAAPGGQNWQPGQAPQGAPGGAPWVGQQG